MAELFSPQVGDAGAVVFSPAAPVQNDTAANAVNALTNLATTFFRTQNVTQSAPEREAEFQRRARAEFMGRMDKAVATGNKVRINALISEGNAVFGSDDWFKSTVQMYTGFDPNTNLNPNTAMMATIQKVAAEDPTLIIGNAVFKDGVIDPEASFQKIASVLSADAANSNILRINRAQELNSWLTETKPTFDAVVSGKVAWVSNLVKNITETGPVSLEQLSQFRSRWNADKITLMSAIPTALPDEERRKLMQPIEAIDKFLTAMETDESILQSAVNANRARVFQTWVTSIQDPQLRAVAVLYGQDEFKTFVDLAMVDTLADPDRTKALMMALKTAGENTSMFTPPASATTIPGTPAANTFESMSIEEILAAPVLAEAMAVPEATRYKTSLDNASLLGGMTPEMFNDPSKVQTATAFAVNTFAQLYNKSGYNYRAKMEAIFTPGFVNNLKNVMDKNPEDAPAISAIMSQALGRERMRHIQQIRLLQEAVPNLQYNLETGQFRLLPAESDKLAKRMAEATPEELRRARIDPERAKEWVKSITTIEGNAEEFLKNNPIDAIERMVEFFGLGTTVQTAMTEMKKHYETVTYLDQLEALMPRPSKTVTSMSFTNPSGFSSETAAVGKQLLPLIDRYEAGGNYNAYFGNKNQSTVDFTSMTVDEVLAYQDSNRIKLPDGNFTTAIGRYQIVSRTLRDLKSQMGLSGQEKFSPELQDRMFLTLVQRRMGQGVLGFRQEWEGFKNVSASELQSIVGR